MITSTRVFTTLLACALLAACHGSRRGDLATPDSGFPVSDSGTPDGGGPPTDAGPPRDLGTLPDFGTPPDFGVPIDFGTTPRCGDFVMNGGEQCDQGGVDTVSCDSDCTFVMCGDHHVNSSSEDCDDGPSGSATCSTVCTSIAAPFCGDGIVNAGETCDDGGTFSLDGCSSTCHTETGWTCSGSPSFCSMTSTGRTIDRSATPATPIPDGSSTAPATITGTISVTGAACTITAITVDVGITHTFSGDLIVSLQSPGFTTVTLHNRTGSSTPNVNGNYPTTLTVDGPGTLADFSGVSAIGTWTLTVSDNAGGDTGTLDSWGLHITCS